MTKRMLIDSSHAEETRVVLLDGNRLEDYDFETDAKKQLKGNIYLAKIVRVEPSLQAAFVEYGGNRHGFLAFGEIHPDYYQIPVADRQKLIALHEAEAEAERAAEEREDRLAAAAEEAGEAAPGELEFAEAEHAEAGPAPLAEPVEGAEPEAPTAPDEDGGVAEMPLEIASETVSEPVEGGEAAEAVEPSEAAEASEGEVAEHVEVAEPEREAAGGERRRSDAGDERRAAQRMLRHYKIQEVIRRRQVILVQVVKEERGTKGAALTTYISLAGRFCVLMPNSPRGGGVSRKITSASDRKRLKEITAELDIPRGMAMIVRTAGAQRPRPEIRRDCEYLLRLWDDIRDTTMASMAPSLIHEEASLIKRAIRDSSGDVEEIVVDGGEGWKAARDFMRMLMPTSVAKVKLWREHQPLFARHNVEGFLDAILEPAVQLRSGGYLVINQTEALVAIDVNSGRSTRERGIEETALRTNLEAADEVGRQLRLRDLAGLIVIDFIDMESRRHNQMVERRLRDAIRQDRARIQVGDISQFGLMEMSRQRMRPSIAESSFTLCSHCNGTGLVRGIESAALHVLRAIEAAGASREAAEVAVHAAGSVALYVLNHKREWLAEIEKRCAMQVRFELDESLAPPAHRIVRTQIRAPEDFVPDVEAMRPMPPAVVADEMEEPAFEERRVERFERVEPEEAAAATDTETAEVPAQAGGEEDGEHKRKRRRRRRRGGKREGAEEGSSEAAASQGDGVEADEDAEGNGRSAADETGGVGAVAEAPAGAAEERETAGNVVTDAVAAEAVKPARGRGRIRAPRRRKRDEAVEAAPPAPMAPYSGPTPADPFGGTFDIFDVLEQSEERAMANPAASAAAVAAMTERAPPPARSSRASGRSESVAAAAMPPVTAPEPSRGLEPVEEPAAAVMPPPVAALVEEPMVVAAAPEPDAPAAPAQEVRADGADAAVAVEESAVQPIVLGADAPPPARRGGWWRRSSPG